jgi:hypothetical protein
MPGVMFSTEQSSAIDICIPHCGLLVIVHQELPLLLVAIDMLTLQLWMT